LFFAMALVVVLLGMAGYYTWRQWQALRHLRVADELDAADRRYYLVRAWRRLVGCGVMVLLAAGLAGTYLLGQEWKAHELGEAQAVEPHDGDAEVAAPDPEQTRWLRQYSTFWIVFSMLLFSLVGLAFWDFLATRRYGMRNLRQIQQDRRAMIEGQLVRLRQQRGGHRFPPSVN
jgi:hypothetical protein